MNTWSYDPEDEWIIQLREWSVTEDGYVRCTVPLMGERLLHRILLGAPKDLEVDHVDNDPLNNRRSNLRLATSSQNNAARRFPQGKLPRGVIEYVRYGVPTGRYRARIRIDGRLRYFGIWDTPEQAALKRDIAALEAFGDFAVLNYPELRGKIS